jgi:primosomal protein N' (replication factor Y)
MKIHGLSITGTLRKLLLELSTQGILDSPMSLRNFYTITPLVYTGRSSSFTYHHDGPLLEPGQLVKIPISSRTIVGIIESMVGQPSFNTKPLTAVLDIFPVPNDLRAVAHWMASYYAASPASVWSTILPSGLAKGRRSIELKPPLVAHGLPLHKLTSEQSSALSTIRSSMLTTQLIEGVTGSGKTRIYLELTAEAISSGHSVIILVPEITLTQQIVNHFEQAFGDIVLTTHSKLTEAKRHAIWTRAHAAMLQGEPRIIIGPRSCLFMPVYQLGLIVIDECHETSYKQEQHPRYQSITTAAFRAQQTNARLILGSATPGLNELYLAQIGKIEHIHLNQRANEIAHSQGIIVDMRNKELFILSKFITQPLHEAINQTLANNRQTLLYLNRRGSASSQICGDCGNVSLCPNCALPLTFHADLMRLICHHCNFRRTSEAICLVCKGSNLRLLGGGTKRIEVEVARLWPHARIARLDRDSATLPYIKTVFKQLRSGELDILIGTQMIAKGLDLPAIDTVGIISADTMLHLPDYTAAERTYQLLSQVSGRTGRGDRAGQVLIQTYSPTHPAIVDASKGAYTHFAHAELSERRKLVYPPFVYLLKLTVALTSDNGARTEALRMATQLRTLQNIAVIGPAPAFLELVGGKYHWMITIKSKSRPPLVEIAQNLPSDKWTADLDPANLL